ncbi:MAG: c-type cytochrome [Opitutaceae bacterium]
MFSKTACPFRPAGSYNVWVLADDFEETKVNLTLAAGAKLERDFSLKPEPRSYAYRIETLPLPRQMIPEISGVAFTPKGSLVATNRRGEVWIRHAPAGEWRRFASGPYEGFGVVANSESDIFVIQRPELTRLHDTNGDGVADVYQTIADGWGITGNYHEFTYGLDRDSAGRPLLNTSAYYTLNRLLSGETKPGPSKIAAIAAALGPPDTARGAEVFHLNCMVCHQADGKGSPQVGTPDYTAADSPLKKPDSELLAIIANGKVQPDGKMMPAFGNVLPPQAIHDVLAYLREAFLTPRASATAP